MLGLTFSSKLDWGSYIVYIAKTASKKIGALIHSMKFLSPEVSSYLYKSVFHTPCMEYCCHALAGAPRCQLELLNKLQKWIYRTTNPSIAGALETLAHPWLKSRYCFGRCSSELAKMVPLPDSRYSARFMIYLPLFVDVTRISMLTVFFLAQLDSGILCLQNPFL